MLCGARCDGDTMTPVERAAWLAGAEKMRKAAAKRCRGLVIDLLRSVTDDDIKDIEDVADWVMGRLNALPLPEPPGKVTVAPIAPNIRRVVKMLRSGGFETTDSGDGVTNVAAGMECAVDFPMVAIKPAGALEIEATRLLVFLREHGLVIEPQGHDAPCIQASFDPVDGSAVILLIGVHDEMLSPPGGVKEEE